MMIQLYNFKRGSAKGYMYINMENLRPLDVILTLSTREHYPIMDGKRSCLLKAEFCLS